MSPFVELSSLFLMPGPTILFKRKTDGGEQKFFACSACRDRKDCNFFLKFEDEWNEKLQEKWNKKKHLLLPKLDHDALAARYVCFSVAL